MLIFVFFQAGERVFLQCPFFIPKMKDRVIEQPFQNPESLLNAIPNIDGIHQLVDQVDQYFVLIIKFFNTH